MSTARMHSQLSREDKKEASGSTSISMDIHSLYNFGLGVPLMQKKNIVHIPFNINTINTLASFGAGAPIKPYKR